MPKQIIKLELCMITKDGYNNVMSGPACPAYRKMIMDKYNELEKKVKAGYDFIPAIYADGWLIPIPNTSPI